MDTGIFSGSTTGNTEAAANATCNSLSDAGDVSLRNVASAAVSEFEKFDVLALGASTWCAQLKAELAG